MDDLVEWLREQLDEDERIARGTGQPSTSWQNVDMDGELRDELNAGTVAYVPREETRAHIARHDPARVLREIDAKRRILNECTYWHDKLAREAVAPPPVPFPALGEVLDAVTPILRALALPYADRPGYREEWQP